ncbi:MAG: DUF2817 domain-containing protein [Candidatus Hydrogenedentes bacterium]|nr:DUF2817 domain-containing protein [Candidatus Hydrogenedentota bacterium]
MIRISQATRCGVLSALVFSVVAAHAFAAAQDARPDAVEVLVAIGGKADIDRLTAAGFLVTNEHELVVSLAVTPEEITRLNALGFTWWQPPAAGNQKDFVGYHNHAEITTDLQDYAAAYPAITRLFNLGNSVQGRAIWAILITDNPDVQEEEPEFKYVGNIHGDEIVGLENCMRLIDLLLNGYGSDTRLTNLVNDTEIWIVPSMNPDGLEAIRRFNASGVDLNRNFPAWPSTITGTYFDGAPFNDTGRPIEVQHIMRWSAENSFVLSANLHGGAVVVNYPYDDDGGPSGEEAPCPDDALMKVLARTYSIHNQPMWNSAVFANGITNGAEWYVIDGGMQDWNYRYLGTIEMTIELSSIKRPNTSTLPQYWEDNRESMLSYMEAVHDGARGLVLDRATNAPLYAQVLVEGNTQPVFTDPDVGDYYRLLLPGAYNLDISAPGYFTWREDGVVVPQDGYVRADVSLTDGDFNGDGAINATDLQLVINGVLGRPVEFDVDVDGRGVQATDVQKIVNRVLQGP